MKFDTVLLCSAVLVLLYAALSINVSRVRLWHRGTARATEAQLTQAVRAHGNAAEYIPLLLVLLLYLNATAPSVFVDAIAVLSVASRSLHVIAMLFTSSVAQRGRLRFVGALGTYASLLALGVALALRAVGF